MLRRLAEFKFKRYDSSSDLLDQPQDVMTSGSQNVMIFGNGRNRVFRGINITSGPLLGGKVMMNVGEDHGGLGDHSETGVGSIFRVLGAWFFIGNGKLYKNGVYQSDSATSTLSIKKMVSGSLGTKYQAGLAQPSAPTITAVTAPSGYSGKCNGVVSAKIARVRAATGARSNASLGSNVVTATNQSIAITFPSADANGQDYWEVDVTKNGEGSVGNHYFLQEIPESVIAATVTASRVATNTTSIGVANGTLTASHIGWQYTSSGDVTTYITAVGANDSYAAGKQAITLNAANGSTNTQSATFTRAVDGITRTYVFEWKDADLVGADLAPIREYPPPAGMFGGASGDVVFVDGALGDTVDTTQYARDNSLAGVNTVSTTSLGNAIAVSDPSRPESFPPDNYVFTGDAPTCVLRGGQGMHWRFGRNSMGVIRYVGGSPAVNYERIWTGIGVQNQNHAVLGAGGRLYAYTGQRGLVRLGVNGEPDTVFATPVHEDMSGWTASNVVLAYDANQQYVLVCHGQTILAFYEPLEVWCAPLEIQSSVADPLKDNVKAAVTYQGDCYLSTGDTSRLWLHNFNQSGGGSPTATYASSWAESEGETDVISRIHLAVRGDTAYTPSVAIYVNGNTSSAAATMTPSIPTASAGQLRHATTMRPNVRSAKSYRVWFSYNPSISVTSPSFGLEKIVLEGETSGVTQ